MNMIRLAAKALLTVTLIAATLILALPAFAASNCPPEVRELDARPYWSSYSDYHNRLLTVDEKVAGTDSCAPCLIRIVGIEATSGVSVASPLPMEIGELANSEVRSINVRYRVPPGVGSFHSRLRVMCLPEPPPPTEASTLTVEPGFAVSNEDCPPAPLPDFEDRTVPAFQEYGPRLFTATFRDAAGNPVAGRSIKWSLSDSFSFRIIESTSITDENGQATALVTPPQYFICIVPYYSKGWTLVTAHSDDGQRADALFLFMRCAPPGTLPPWFTP